jgi:phage tail-like protein
MADNPVGGWNFTISLLDSASAAGAILQAISPPVAAGFSECSGLETTMSVEDYREGGRNDAVLRFPGHITWAPIRLRRGVTATPDLWRWYEAFLRGNGKRRDGVITLRDDHGESVRVWRFHRGIPSRWAGPALHAAASAVAIEELEITHEGIRPEGTGIVSEIAGAVTSIAEAFG